MVCGATLEPRMDELNQMVLDFFENKVLTLEAIEDAVREAQKRVWERRSTFGRGCVKA